MDAGHVRVVSYAWKRMQVMVMLWSSPRPVNGCRSCFGCLLGLAIDACHVRVVS